MENDLDIWDVYEFVREIYRKENPEEADEVGDIKLEEYLYEKFEFESFDGFVKFISELMDFVPVLKSPLTKEYHHCLGIQNEDGLFIAILKKKYDKK